jgi:hypothetical protein
LSSHHRDLAASTLLEQRRIEKEKQQFVDDTNKKTAEAISKVRKSSAAQVTQMQDVVKEKNKLIEGIHDLAEGVALEYSTLKRSSKAEAESLKKSADSRLLNLQKSKQRESALRESLDSVKETFEDKLFKAQEMIAQLKQELGDKADVILGLEAELANAQKEVTVS